MKIKTLYLVLLLPAISMGLAGEPGSSGGETVIIHGDRSEKKIALTFDACSIRGKNKFDSTIARILIKTDTPATLFLGGYWMEQNPGAVRFLAQQPNLELALHGYWHPHFCKLSDDSVRKELEHNQRVLQELTGKKARFFRPPYGEYDQRIVKLAGEQGLTLVKYDLPSGDPSISVSSEELIKDVATLARNGSIVVMHINGRGWNTAAALPMMIQRLRRRGLQLVKVSDLHKEEMKKDRPERP